MFKRLRQLEISLAAKCQLLFGAAVVLILAAALFVPWLRMELLTDQINERSARALAESAKAQHLAWAARGEAERSRVEMPSRLAGGATTLPVDDDGRAVAVPRMVAVWDPPARSTGFERRLLAHFEKHENVNGWVEEFETRDGVSSVRFALALRAESACVRCHAGQIAASGGWGKQAVAAATRAGAATRGGGGGGAAATQPADDEDGDGDGDAVAEGRASTGSGLVAAATRPVEVPGRGSAPAALAGAAATRPAATQLAGAAAAIPDTALIGYVRVEMPSQVEVRQLLLNRVFILVAGGFAGTLAFLVFYLITNKLILQPVRVLRETAEKVSKGDLNVRSHIFTGDEFQHLSETFNVMLANLKESEDQLRAINKSLDLKLGQLAESNVALYESNRLKSEFLANVSHELRTPLNSILGFAELLRDTQGGNGDQRTARYLQNILTSGRNLLELINDLLDLAKIEAGRMEVRSAPLSLSDLFEGLTGILKPLCEKKGLTIDTVIGRDVPILQTDAAKLQQVLYNFLSNAIKFSPAGGVIDLAAERVDEGRVRLSVTDRGPGIAEDKQQMIFEKFRQIDGSVTREHGGTGLGLAISKELAGLLGGEIGVRSVAGEGACFWLVLPVRIEARAEDVRAGLVLS